MITHMVTFKGNFLSRLTMIPPRTKDQLTKTLVPGMKNLLLSFWARLPRKLPKTTVYCSCPWVPPEVEGKTPLLKTPYTSDTGPRGP